MADISSSDSFPTTAIADSRKDSLFQKPKNPYVGVQETIKEIDKDPEEISDKFSLLGLDESQVTPEVKQALIPLIEEIFESRKRIKSLQHMLDMQFEKSLMHVVFPVFNRRAFDKKFEEHVEHALRGSLEGSLALIWFYPYEELRLKIGTKASEDILDRMLSKLAELVGPNGAVGNIEGGGFAISNPFKTADEIEKELKRLSDIVNQPISIKEEVDLGFKMLYAVQPYGMTKETAEEVTAKAEKKLISQFSNGSNEPK